MQLLSSCTLAELWRWQEALDVLKLCYQKIPLRRATLECPLAAYPLNTFNAQELLVKKFS